MRTPHQPCYYCGRPPYAIDHIPPRAIRPFLAKYGLEHLYPAHDVPACTECNSVLNVDYPTLDERVSRIQEYIRQRYGGDVTQPQWWTSVRKKLRVAPSSLRPDPAPLSGTCEQCGTAYTPKQDYQKFCSPRCRQQAYWARRVRREAERLLAEQAPHEDVP